MAFLFPDRCVYCGEMIGRSGVPMCRDCIRTLPVLREHRCKICGRELTHCFCKAGDYAFDRNISLLRYEGSAKTLVKRMKFGKKPQLIKFMGDELSALVRKEYRDISFDFITYVPMHPVYKIKRGFNQSEELAKYIGASLNLPVLSSLSKRFTFKKQKNLLRKERLANVRGSFKAIGEFGGKRILLVDDVLTTGATLSECALTLKRSGALQIYTVTFAITYKK